MPRKPIQVTHCTVCDRDDVGVWQTRFNAVINPQRGQSKWPIQPKTARHRYPDGRPCPGSGLTVPESTVMENR